MFSSEGSDQPHPTDPAQRLHGRRKEVTSLHGILLALEQTPAAQPVRGASTLDSAETTDE